MMQTFDSFFRSFSSLQTKMLFNGIPVLNGRVEASFGLNCTIGLNCTVGARPVKGSNRGIVLIYQVLLPTCVASDGRICFGVSTYPLRYIVNTS